MPERKESVRYEQALSILPNRLRRIAMTLPEDEKRRAEEIRLRAGRAMCVLLPEGERTLSGECVEQEELENLCDLATEFSRYAALETLRSGFLPVQGGFRVGLCGSAVMKEEENTNLKNLSSAVIRIGRERRGIADALLPELLKEGRFRSTLLLSPPGGGKTTLLRELVRRLSDGWDAHPPLRISLIDERGEVAVMVQGEAQMDVGAHTDVLDGCPKAIGIPMVLRAMNPQVIAVDEITAHQDLQAVSMAAGCGVALLATIHAGCVEELTEKPLYRELLGEGIFRQAVSIQAAPDGTRNYEVTEL